MPGVRIPFRLNLSEHLTRTARKVVGTVEGAGERLQVQASKPRQQAGTPSSRAPASHRTGKPKAPKP